MSKTQDLSLVRPARRDETQRRIQAIEEFILAPGRAAAEKHAAALGLRPAQFYNLVRAWRNHGRPEMIARPGGGRTPKDFTDEQNKLICKTIEAHFDMQPRLLVQHIMKKAAEEGVTMPRQELVTAFVSRARPSVLPTAVKHGCDFLIDHTVLAIPVQFGNGRPVRPLATVLIETGLQKIVGVTLSEGTPMAKAAASAVLDALRPAPKCSAAAKPGSTRLRYAWNSSGEWDQFDAALTADGILVERYVQGPYEEGQLVEALLGRRTRWLQYRPRLVWAQPKRRLCPISEGVPALTPDTALDAIRPLMVGSVKSTIFAQMNEKVQQNLECALSQIA